MSSNISKWDHRYLTLAQTVASWSKDPSTQTGAVIVRPDNSVVSLGYNGFPKGVCDHEHRYADRETKYALIVHCEMNAILSARESVAGCTLYTWPFMSCNRCAVHVAQSGIIRAVAPNLPASLEDRWGTNLEMSRMVFQEAGITLNEVEFD